MPTYYKSVENQVIYILDTTACFSAEDEVDRTLNEVTL